MKKTIMHNFTAFGGMRAYFRLGVALMASDPVGPFVPVGPRRRSSSIK